MSIDRAHDHDHDCACDCCGLALSEDDYEHQERLRIDFKAGYASVFGDGNTVRAVLCQHCVQKHLGPWLTIIAESEGADAPPTSSPRRYQSYQFKELGAEHATEASSVRHEQQAGWLGRAYQKLWNIPVWALMAAAGALLVLFILVSSMSQFERTQLVLTTEGCQAMAAHGVSTEPLPESALCRLSGLYDRGKIASKRATIRVETEAGPIEVRLSHDQIVSHSG